MSIILNRFFTLGSVEKMKIIITGDHAGMTLRSEVKSVLEERGIEFEDVEDACKTFVDNPDNACEPTEREANGEFDGGIFICGTGIRISITANKVKGIRCTLAHDVFSAKATRQHNNANILAMGERVIGPGLAREIVTTWLDTPFEGGRHETRINKISAYEQDHS